MRHRKAGAKLGRTTSHRQAMLRNMVTSLFEHEKVTTTEAKAKAVKPMAEKLITLAKRGDLHARRQALAVIRKKAITHKLFSEIKDRYMERTGGYTSIVKIGPRVGDNAPMAVLELLKPEDKVKAGKKKPKRKRAQKKKEAKAEAAAKEAAAPAPAQETATAPVEEPAPAVEPETAQAPEAAAEVETETAEAPAEPEAETAEAPAEPEAETAEAPAEPETGEEEPK